MKAMLFAAGLGTRLKPITDKCPKALVEVNNKTLLEHNIRYLQGFGIYEVVVNIHHFGASIVQTLQEQAGFGSRIDISDETDNILETGGGLKKAAHYFYGEENFVVMNVDVLTNLDLGKMIAAHFDDNSMATLAVMQRDSSRQFLFDENMTLCGWINNKTGEQRISKEDVLLRPFAFSGIQVLSQRVLQDMPFEGKFSLVDEYLYLAKSNVVKGYDHTGDLFIDVGKPGTIEKASSMFR